MDNFLLRFLSCWIFASEKKGIIRNYYFSGTKSCDIWTRYMN